MESKGKYYWKITTLEEEIWMHADSIGIEQECLTLYHNTSGIVSIFSKGNWLCIFPASHLDGGCPYIEHIDKVMEEE